MASENNSAQGTEEATEQRPAGAEYMSRAVDADSRISEFYWVVCFLAYVLIVDSPKMAVAGLRWRIDLLRGRLPQLDGECRMKGCDRRSVIYLPDQKSYSDGTPVCGRHYVAVKTIVYGFLGTLLFLFAYGFYGMVIA